MSAKIHVKNLCKTFDGHRVLHRLSFDVEKGKSLVIIGGSGSGKSVTLKCILGLIPPDRGTITIDGHAMTQLTSPQRIQTLKKIGMLFQGGALFDSLPVWQNITFAPLSEGTLSKKEARDYAMLLLDEVGLPPETAFKYPSELSGGMQKRVALARAIAPKPDIIFFDEPTAGLDPIMCNVIDHLIKTCTEKLGATTITITHDLRSVDRIADNVALLFEGSIIWQGTLEEFHQTQDPHVKQFVTGALQGPLTAGGSKL